jgi:hypothetical protein
MMLGRIHAPCVIAMPMEKSHAARKSGMALVWGVASAVEAVENWGPEVGRSGCMKCEARRSSYKKRIRRDEV